MEHPIKVLFTAVALGATAYGVYLIFRYTPPGPGPTPGPGSTQDSVEPLNQQSSLNTSSSTTDHWGSLILGSDNYQFGDHLLSKSENTSQSLGGVVQQKVEGRSGNTPTSLGDIIRKHESLTVNRPEMESSTSFSNNLENKINTKPHNNVETGLPDSFSDFIQLDLMDSDYEKLLSTMLIFAAFIFSFIGLLLTYKIFDLDLKPKPLTLHFRDLGTLGKDAIITIMDIITPYYRSQYRLMPLAWRYYFFYIFSIVWYYPVLITESMRVWFLGFIDGLLKTGILDLFNETPFVILKQVFFNYLNECFIKLGFYGSKEFFFFFKKGLFLKKNISFASWKLGAFLYYLKAVANCEAFWKLKDMSDTVESLNNSKAHVEIRDHTDALPQI